jgi:hypothetical protein
MMAALDRQVPSFILETKETTELGPCSLSRLPPRAARHTGKNSLDPKLKSGYFPASSFQSRYFMRMFLASLALLFCVPLGAAEPTTNAKKVLCHIRGLEGDPSGSIEKGTIKVLWEPHLATVIGEEVSYGSGSDNEVPGTAQTLYGGVWVSIKPTHANQGKVTARIALEMTRLDDTDRQSFLTSSGRLVRAVGTFAWGKPVKIVGQEKINGKQFWIEVTFEEPQTGAPISVPKKPDIVPATLQRDVRLPKKKTSP